VRRILPRCGRPLAPALAAACAASGCVGIDAGWARTCRSAIPALNHGAEAIEIGRSAALATGSGLRIHYRVQLPAGAGWRERFVECRFAPGGPADHGGQRLVDLRTEAGPLGEVRLHLLKRFWLEREGASADPQPVANAGDAPPVPRPAALALQHLLFALPPIAIYALLAAAYSLIYGLVGRINFAFGELAAVGGYAAFLAFALAGSAPGVAAGLAAALLLAATSSVSYGLAAGRLVFAPLSAAAGQQLLIGTVALALMLQEYLRLAQGARLVWLQPMLSAPYALARSGDFLVTITPMAASAVGICLLAAGGVLALMRASRFGRAWRACADDPGAAALLGIDRRRVLVVTFALASGLAGLAGCVVTVYYGTFGYAGGVALGLKALLAAIAGGIGSVSGAFLGGILLGAAESVWSALFPIEYRDPVVFLLFSALLIARPHGLFGFAAPLPARI